MRVQRPGKLGDPVGGQQADFELDGEWNGVLKGGWELQSQRSWREA